MASYENDSSEGEGGDYTETSVLLGYASKDSAGETISRLGGRPEWLDAGTTPSAALATCKNCRDLMVLLLQLNGELPERFPNHERRLYVFACLRRSCRRKDGSIRAMRAVKVSPSASGSTRVARAEDEKSKATQANVGSGINLGEQIFGGRPLNANSNPFSADKANPFSAQPQQRPNPFGSAVPGAGTNASALSRAEPKQSEVETKDGVTTQKPQDLSKSFAMALSLDSKDSSKQTFGPAPPPEPWPAVGDQPKPYLVSYLSEAEYETLDPTPLLKVPQTTSMDIDSSEGTDSGGKEDKVVFESSMDSVFQKFADRLAQNPEQAIRYEFGGQPLLYSKADAVGKLLHEHQSGDGSSKVTVARGMPRCPACGSGRVFEVQLTPHAITELEAEEDGLDGMDWGTIIIGVCERDCLEKTIAAGEASYLEEWAGVQWEELTMQR